MGTRLGAMRTAAVRRGLSLAQYLEKIAEGLKYCAACDAWHPRRAFNADSARPDGLHVYCAMARSRANAEGRAA